MTLQVRGFGIEDEFRDIPPADKVWFVALFG